MKKIKPDLPNTPNPYELLIEKAGKAKALADVIKQGEYMLERVEDIDFEELAVPFQSVSYGFQITLDPELKAFKEACRAKINKKLAEARKKLDAMFS